MFPEKDVLVVICAYVCIFLLFSLFVFFSFLVTFSCVWSVFDRNSVIASLWILFLFFVFLLCFLPHLLGANWREKQKEAPHFSFWQSLYQLFPCDWGSRLLYLSRRETAVRNPIELLSKHGVNCKSSGIAYCGAR